MKKALITGITGQDGSYLAEFLLTKGYRIIGVTSGNGTRHNIAAFEKQIEWVIGDVTNDIFVNALIREHKPDEVYNLASVATVAKPWEDTVNVSMVAGFAPLLFLEAIRRYSTTTRFFQASSAEMFSAVPQTPKNELSPFAPKNPYGIAKLFAHNMVQGYRKQGLFAVSGILFNHESPRRPADFVTRKITSTAARIKAGFDEKLHLGNLDAKRDWGYAPEYVEAMWLMLQQSTPHDYVIGTGVGCTVREFVREAFAYVGLEWERYVEIDPQYYRPVEVDELVANPHKAETKLGWKAKTSALALMRLMVDYELKKYEIEG